MSCYGDERDRLAHALATMLAADEPPTSRTDSPRMLQYRDLVLISLTSIADEVLGGAPNVKPTLGATAATPARVLRTTLHSLPRAGDPAAPTDVLHSTPRTQHARTWRTAAQATMLAADALAAAEPTSWRADHNTGWSVMADTAAAAHALAVLDRRLATHPNPHLPDAAREALHASWRTGLRLIASEVSRLAHTQPLSNDADHLARPPALRPFPISEPSQLAAGYQQLLRLLQARDGMLPIRTLGHLAVAQARIGRTLSDHCHQAHTAGIASAAELADTWRSHARTAEQLAEHRRAVTGLHRGTHHPALAQAGEVLRAAERLTTHSRHEPAITVAAAAALHPLATHIERTLAHGITRSFANDLYLVANDNLTRRRHSYPWIPAHHTTEEHPLLATARDIQNTATPRPTPPTERSTTALSHLQHARLTHQPSRSGPPTMNLG